MDLDLDPADKNRCGSGFDTLLLKFIYVLIFFSLVDSLYSPEFPVIYRIVKYRVP
jgi:hypothetical protein